MGGNHPWGDWGELYLTMSSRHVFSLVLVLVVTVDIVVLVVVVGPRNLTSSLCP